MNLITRGAAALCTASLLFVAGSSVAQDYVPRDGEAVIVYVQKFKPADFEHATQLVAEGFSEAMTDSGQTRHTYFLADPESSQMLTVSFFAEGHSPDEWHDNDARERVLEQLRPLYREPLTMQRYHVVGSHNTGE